MFEEYGEVVGMTTEDYGFLYSMTLLCDVSKTLSYISDMALYGRSMDIPLCLNGHDHLRWVYYVFDRKDGIYIRLWRELYDLEKRDILDRMLHGERAVDILGKMGLLYEDEA